METSLKKTAGRSAALPAAASLRPAVAVERSNRSRLQTASKVSSPQDAEEKEADSTAQKVMRMAIPSASVGPVRTPRGIVFRQLEQPPKPPGKISRSPYIARFVDLSVARRQAAVAEEREKVQRQAEEKEETLQRQPEEEEEEEAALQRQVEQEEEEETLQRQPEEEEEEAVLQRQVEQEEEEEETLQRQPEEEEEEEQALQRQAEEEEEETVQCRADAKDHEDAVRRQPAPQNERIQRKADGMPDLRENVSAEIRSAKSGGQPLPLSVRRFMEPRFKADFSRVRIHTGEQAARLNRQVRARAFAIDNHVFFGQGQFRPESDQGRELIAHELTHTIQQGGALQRKAGPRVTQRSDSRVQRLGIGDALDYFADRAHNIPGFRMFTIIIGVNPINMSRVDRSAANILRAIVEFLPGGALITRALDNHGILERVANWVERQFRSLAITGAAIRRALDRFLDSLSWRDIFSLGSVWNRARRIFTEPIRRLISFGRSLYRGIVQFIKDAILRPLAQAVSRTRGYDLLTAVLGYDPITGDAVPRTAETLIGGFMRLIGQQEVWDNIRRANAIPRAWAWFQGALAGLMGFVRQIPRQFINTFRSLEIVDLVVVPRAVARVIGFFAGVAGRFFSWAGGQVMQLLQIIFEVVAPGAMPFIRRARGAFRSIIQNPAGFVRNLVAAARQGLNNFATNFLTHLRTSLINWITGAMSGAGVYIPQAFTLREILKFVLSVLGLTWQNIRVKLVRVIGETAVSAMESGFELVRTLVTEGPAAAWQKILEGMQNLRDMVIEQIMSFVQSRIVQAAITRLISMLSPAGAFIQAIIAIYNTIMFFIERLRTIAQVAMSFVNSMAAIAAGNIGAAAARVEQTMAGLLTLVISFLARIAGLGRVADAVTRIIDRVRQPIDRALDRVVAWIVRQARRLGRFVAQAGVPQDPAERLRLGLDRAVAIVNRLPRRGIGERVISAALAAIKVRYGFRVLVPYQQGDKWWVRGEINPGGNRQTDVAAGAAASDDPDAERARARSAFGARLFSRARLQGELGVSASTAQRRVSSWMSGGSLHKLASAPSDPLTLYSFDAAKAGQRETNPNNRAKYGYSNPSKDSSTGLQILSIGLLRNRSPQPIGWTSAAYHRTRAWYRSVVTSTVFQWARAILGHRPPGASGHWNRIGHTQPRSANMAWNRQVSSYHGPEEAGESSATGGSSERYRVPSEEAGSHPSWW